MDSRIASTESHCSGSTSNPDSTPILNTSLVSEYIDEASNATGIAGAGERDQSAHSVVSSSNYQPSYLSIPEYEDLALRIISKLKIRGNFLHKNQEFIGEAIHELIRADERFNGKGDLRGYRHQRIKWLVLSYMKKRKNKQKNGKSLLLFSEISPRAYANKVDSRYEIHV